MIVQSLGVRVIYLHVDTLQQHSYTKHDYK